MKKKLLVSAALIWDEGGTGKFMICKRPEEKARGGLWEFVGGKTEAGESKAESLIRECREELNIEVLPRDIFMELEHEYPDVIVHLTVFNCVIAGGELKLLEHQDMKWIRPEEIDDYEFCPADETVLEKIKGMNIN